MTVLTKTTEVATWRTGGDPSHERKLPGRSMYEPLILEQGLTHDPVLKRWANIINDPDGDSAMSLNNFRKDIVINVLNVQGAVAISYKVHRAWVSEY